MSVPAFAEEQSYRFVWDGGGGYSMVGALSFDAREATGIVREKHLTCFEIEGFRGEERIGRWDLSQKRHRSAWRLHFIPQLNRFMVEGEGINMPQAWNMDGDGSGCGPEGFGFNLGNVAQDICLNDELIEESQVSPYQKFSAVRDDTHRFGAGACRGSMLLGQLSE